MLDIRHRVKLGSDKSGKMFISVQNVFCICFFKILGLKQNAVSAEAHFLDKYDKLVKYCCVECLQYE